MPVEPISAARAPRRLALERRGEAAASRVALVLGAGGSRGAYEAGVLAHLYEEIHPELPPGFEFDIVSGTSVGALHAAYLRRGPFPRSGGADPRLVLRGRALRLGTPLSPAVRLGADRVLVITPGQVPGAAPSEYSEAVLAQPAFLLGKVSNAIGMDQLASELERLAGPGGGPRHVDVVTLSPRAAVRGVPEGEADLLSYLYFDRSFTRELVELGRADAERAHDRILGLLGEPCAVAA